MGTRCLYPSLDRETDIIEYPRATGLAGTVALFSATYQTIFGGGSRALASSRYFTVSADASHQIGTSDFMFFCVVSRASTGRMVIWEQYQDADNYVRLEIDANNKVHFIAVIAGATVCKVRSSLTFGLAAGSLVGVSLDRDDVANCKAWVDGVDQTSTVPGEVVTSTSSITTGAANMTIGGSPSIGNYFTGSIQSICFAKPADVSVVAAEATSMMYSYRRLWSYADLTPNHKSRWGVTAFYDCNETSASANLIDKHGACDGTPSGEIQPGLPLSVTSIQDCVFSAFLQGNLLNYDANAIISSWRSDVPAAPYLAGATSLNLLGPSSQYVAIPAFFITHLETSDFSLACWVKTTSTSRAILYWKWTNNTKGFSLEVDASGYLLFTLNETSATGSHIINDGEWHHVAVTADRDGVATLYVDGVVSGTPVALNGQAIPLDYAAMCIGSDQFAGTYLTGSVTDIRVYGYVLSAARVAALASGYPANPNWPPNPDKSWFKFYGKVFQSIGDGDPVVCSYAFNGSGSSVQASLMQTTASSRPVYRLAGIGPGAAVEFDGTDDYLVSVEPTGLGFLSSTVGLVDAVVTPSAIGSEMTIMAASDTTRDNMYLQFGIDADGKAFIEANDGGTVDRVTGNTVVSAATAYRFRFFTTGSQWSIEVGSTSQTLTVTGTNSGKWFGSLTDLSAWSVGALVTSSGAADYLAGKVGEVVICLSLPGARTRQWMSRVSRRKYGLSS